MGTIVITCAGPEPDSAAIWGGVQLGLGLPRCVRGTTFIRPMSCDRDEIHLTFTAVTLARFCVVCKQHLFT